MHRFAAEIHSRAWRLRYRWFHRRLAVVNAPLGMVSFTFDDFPATAADVAAPMLVAQGWRGTYYLAPGLIGSDASTGTICSETGVTRLHRDGHEIGNHTYSHARCVHASRSLLQDEFNRSQRRSLQFGGARNFAFPYGAYDDAALAFFGRRFDTLRTIDPGVNSGFVDLNQLKANAIYESTDPGKLNALLRQTRDEAGWLVLYTHDVCSNPSDFGCTPTRFGAVISAVKEVGLAVHTVGEAFRHLDLRT